MEQSLAARGLQQQMEVAASRPETRRNNSMPAGESPFAGCRSFV
jgi:hypothetical protein